MENLMINNLNKDIRYSFPFLINQDTYLLSLNGRELIELIGKHYDKIFGNYNIENSRYKSLWKEAEVDYIAKGLVSGEWIGINTFYVNVLKKTERDITFTEKENKVIISINSEIALLEQYNLYLAIEKVYKLGLEIPNKFGVNVSNLDIKGLQEWFSQRVKEGAIKGTRF